MDLLLNMVKGHHMEKINDFEEKIKRLRKYNKDLRYELARQNRVTIKTSDEAANDDEDQELSSHSVSDDHLVPFNCFKNALIVDKIFGYLDITELKVCRLVCEDWNEAVSSILSKQNNGNGLGVNLSLEVLYDDDDDDGGEDVVGFVEEKDLQRTQEIHSIVEAAPENWFKSVNLDGNLRSRDAYKSVFQDFGNRLKVIKFTRSDLHIQTLRSILLNWCPNLEEFEFCEPHVPLEHDKVLIISRPLKLTSLSFNVDSFYESIPFEGVALTDIVFTIIKNSPNLKKLKSLGSCTTITKEMFSKLRNHPQIMNNLEEIYLRNPPLNLMDLEDYQDPLETFSNIQFQSKLKTLVLTELKPGQSIALNRLLSMTNESLEKLTLTSNDRDLPASVEDPNHPNLQLKQMNRLVEFRYHAHRQGLKISIDIAKMPNLKIFVLGFERQYSNRYGEDDFIDKMFSNCRQLMRNPNQNLKELYLFGYIRNPKSTFEVIEIGFPNVSKLTVWICHKEPQNKDEFDELFTGISRLKKLNKLFLDFKYFEYNLTCMQKIDGIFSGFKKLPNLIHLTMRGEIIFVYVDEAIFSKIPKLQRLTIIGATMNLAKAKRFGQLLNERGIFLDIK